MKGGALMKRFLCLLGTLVLLTSLCATALAEDVVCGEYTYKLKENSGASSEKYRYTPALTGYTGTAETLVLPAELDGHIIRRVDDSAFWTNETLRSVTIPEGYYDIGAKAFGNCAALEEVRLPDSLTSIAWSAFQNCENLREIVFPEGLIQLEIDAFLNTALETVHIPASMFVLENAFTDCESLREITVSPENPYLYAQANVVFDHTGSLLIYPGGREGDSYAVPEGVIEINPYAFKGAQLSSVSLPDSIRKIWRYAFSATGLTSFTLPGSVAEMPEQMLSFCASLETVTVEEGVKSLGNDVFLACERLASVTLPSTLTAIGGGAFWGCKALPELVIPASVTSIGKNCFQFCPNLVLVVAPGSYAEQYAIENEILYRAE